MRVVVVEDDEDLLQVTTVVLKRAGHEVVSAMDGREGLLAIRHAAPDVVLLDLMLPELDGYEVLEELAEDDLPDPPPVVIVSALVGSHDRLRALDLGATDTMTKPFSSDGLLALVEEIGGATREELTERRRRAIDRLRESPPVPASRPSERPDAERLAGVLDLSVDAIVSVDEHQRIIGFNRGAASIFGYSPEEILGEPLDRLLPPDLTAAHHEHLRTFARAPETSRHMGERREIHGRRRDGSLFPAEASILKHVVDGRPTFTAVLRDVSQRRQLIDELRARARQQAAVADLGQRALAGGARDEFLREVANTVAATLAVELVILCEVSGTDRIAMRAAVGLEGPIATLPSGSHLAEVVSSNSPVVVGPGSDGPGVRLPGDRPVVGGIGVPLTDSRRTFGALGAYSGVSRSFSEDDVHFLQAVANVVAGFVERERVETRLRRFLDAAPDATLVVAGDGTIVSANPQAEELLGYSQDRLVGRLVEDLVPPRIRTAHVRHRDGYAHEPRLRTMGAGRELSVLHADGSEIAVDIMLSPVETDEGLLVVAALRDVTERRRSEAMREAFLRAVSHDLRTPLAALIGYASLVVEDQSIQGESRTFLERVVANGEKLGRLLTDLLDLDRLSRGVLEPNRRLTSLADLARSVVSSLDLPGHDVQVIEDRPDVVADVDPAQVERILENLLANVGRHTPLGTACRVRVDRDDEGALLVVEDEGPGVPDSVKAAIFDPFQRGAANDHSPGTGIGLSLVARFAELHGGGADVEDRPGGGARFVVRLGRA